MIILFLAQLLIGTIFVLGLFGQLLNVGQKILRPEKPSSLLMVTTIITVFFYCMIAFYYSECVDLYAEKHNGKTFIAIATLFLLAFMLNGPAKYANTKEESGQILIAGTIGSIFYIVIRFLPGFGDTIFGWFPIVIWT